MKRASGWLSIWLSRFIPERLVNSTVAGCLRLAGRAREIAHVEKFT